MLALMRKSAKGVRRAQVYYAAYRPRIRIGFMDNTGGKMGAIQSDIFESSSELSEKNDVLVLM